MWRIILLIILLLLFFILFLPISIFIVYKDKLEIYLKILFIKKNLYSSVPEIDVKKFTARGIRKQLKREQKKISDTEKKPDVKSTKKKNNIDIKETISMINDIIIRVKDKFFRYLRIKVANIRVIISTDDAAKTAIEYGIAVQLIQYTVTLLQNITNFSVNDNTSIVCDVDYLKGKSELSCNLSFTLRVWHMLAVALSAAAAYIKNTTRHKRKGEDKNGRN